MSITMEFRGLIIDGTTSYVREENISYSHGGLPEEYSSSIENISIEDWDTFSEWGLLEYVSELDVAWFKHHYETRGVLDSQLEKLILSYWEDDIREALFETA